MAFWQNGVNSFSCHPEEPQATKDLRSSSELQLPRFFASLRMTAFVASSPTSLGQHLPNEGTP